MAVTSTRSRWPNRLTGPPRAFWRYPKIGRMTAAHGDRLRRPQGGVRVVEDRGANARPRRAALRARALSLLRARLAAARTSNTSNASLTARGAAVRPDHRVRVDRRSAGRRVQSAGRRSLRRGAGAPARDRLARGRRDYRVRGYLAAAGRSAAARTFPGCGTSTTTTELRALRITGEEAGGRGAATPGASPTSRCCAGSPAPAWTGSRLSCAIRRGPLEPDARPPRGDAASRPPEAASAARARAAAPERRRAARPVRPPAEAVRNSALTD